jgi:creatinine amidohydrolase
MSNASTTPWKLAALNYAQVKTTKVEVAVLPLGCTEPHNLHLPYATDTLEADAFGACICARAWEAGAKVVLLPTIPYGTTTNQRQCVLSMNVNPSTLGAMISDLVESLVGHGIRKIMLLNSHGGNDLKPLLRELYPKTDARLFLCNWYQMVADVYDEIFEQHEDHAGEMETSIALAHFPSLVARDDRGRILADDGAKTPTRFLAVNRGWVSFTRPWHLLTTNTGAGDPRAATAEKGHRLTEIITERLARFLIELSAAEIDDNFPFAID